MATVQRFPRYARIVRGSTIDFDHGEVLTQMTNGAATVVRRFQGVICTWHGVVLLRGAADFRRFRAWLDTNINREFLLPLEEGDVYAVLVDEISTANVARNSWTVSLSARYRLTPSEIRSGVDDPTPATDPVEEQSLSTHALEAVRAVRATQRESARLGSSWDGKARLLETQQATLQILAADKDKRDQELARSDKDLADAAQRLTAAEDNLKSANSRWHRKRKGEDYGTWRTNVDKPLDDANREIVEARRSFTEVKLRNDAAKQNAAAAEAAHAKQLTLVNASSSQVSAARTAFEAKEAEVKGKVATADEARQKLVDAGGNI